MPTIKVILSAIIVLFIASCGLMSSEQSPKSDLPEFKITTSTGISQGRLHATAVEAVGAEIVSWFDIPYAQPPVGDLRWRAPRELVAPAQTIVERESTACVQFASVYAGAEGEGAIGSEDCLYLDIRAPKNFASKQYPVMVWIHGGGNTTGLKDYYDFSALAAEKEVVVVAINYRLGALGWFTHPAIQGLQGDQNVLDKASNFGQLDIIQSLKWVRDNIAGFGGDRNNVTIFGESAGAHNVYALLASPLSKGLFHRAIAQSGYTVTNSLENSYNRDAANSFVTRGSWQVAEEIVAGDGRKQAALSPQALRDELKNIDAREFIGFYQETSDADYTPLSTGDGVVIPRVGIAAALADPQYAKNVPVISGANKDEVTLWFAMHRYFMEASYPFTKLLPPRITVKNPALYKLWIRTRSHAWKIRGVDGPLSSMEHAGYTELYSYRFDWDDQASSFFIDFPTIFGAAHGTDISFVSGDFKYGPVTDYIYPAGEARDQMQHTVMNIWGDFAHAQAPDNSLALTWPRYNSESRPFIHLDTDDQLRLNNEDATLESLLANVAADTNASHSEKCLLVWETLINIGNPDIARHRSWNQGQCEQFDARAEQRRIAAELIAEYGKTSVL